MKNFFKTWWVVPLILFVVFGLYNPFPLYPSLIEDKCFQCATHKVMATWVAVVIFGGGALILSIWVILFFMSNGTKAMVVLGVTGLWMIFGVFFLEQNQASVLANFSVFYFFAVLIFTVSFWIAVQMPDPKAQSGK